MLTEEKVITPIIAKPAGPSVHLSLHGRTMPFVIIKNETINYSSKLFESGYEIREEPALSYGIRSS
jgi:hypothetical protein